MDEKRLMTEYQHTTFIRELSQLCVKHRYAFGGGGHPDLFKLVFYPRDGRKIGDIENVDRDNSNT